MKIYLAFPLFLESDIKYNKLLASKLRRHGFEVYNPCENDQINDKTRSDINGMKIYKEDIKHVMNCNVLVYQVADFAGQNWEAGFMDCLSQMVDQNKYYGIVGLITDVRLKTMPNEKKIGVDNQAFYVNQFVVGALKQSLGIYLDIDSMIDALIEVREKHERS